MVSDAREVGAGHHEENDELEPGHLPYRMTLQNEPAIDGQMLMPFAHGINPHTAAASSSNVEWVRHLQLIPEDRPHLLQNLINSKFEQLGGLCYRYCSLPQLEIATNMMTTLFVFDDMFDNERSTMRTDPALTSHIVDYIVAGVSDEERPHLEPNIPGHRMVVAIANALNDVTRRTLMHNTKEGAAYYIQYMIEYLHSCVVESQWQHRDTIREDDYSTLRSTCGAVYPSIELGFVLTGSKLPEDIRNNADFQSMQRNACLCVSYVNDIFSYEKDRDDGIFTNLALIKQREHNVDTVTAIRAAETISNRTVESYIAAKGRMQRDTRITPVVQRYINQMEHWMRGNFDWYNERRTERYVHCLSTATVI